MGTHSNSPSFFQLSGTLKGMACGWLRKCSTVLRYTARSLCAPDASPALGRYEAAG